MNTDKILAEAIAKEYAPKDNSKITALRKLDHKAKLPAIIFAYSFGIASSLVAGLGMCLAMQVIGSGVVAIALGVILGIVGSAIMISAYPIYKTLYKKTKEKLTPRILELANELSCKKDQI